jgi:hypothetical protein
VTRSGEAIGIDLADRRAPRLSGGAHFVAEGWLDDALLRGLTGTEQP